MRTKFREPDLLLTLESIMELLAHMTGIEFVDLFAFFFAGVATGLSIAYVTFRRMNPPGDR